MDVTTVPSPPEPEVVISPPLSASERRTKYQKLGDTEKKTEEPEKTTFTDSDKEVGLTWGIKFLLMKSTLLDLNFFHLGFG